MEEFLTVQEAARALKLSTESVRRYLRSGQLAGVKLGGGRAWRVKASDVRALLASDGQRVTVTLRDGSQVTGRLTTAHAASSYGQPVFVDDAGQAYDRIDYTKTG